MFSLMRNSFSPNEVVQGSHCGLRVSFAGSHNSSLVRCPCAFRLRKLAQSGCPVLCSSESLLLPARCAVFPLISIFHGRRNLDGVLKGSKLYSFVKLSPFLV